jgi:hypothetical protein
MVVSSAPSLFNDPIMCWSSEMKILRLVSGVFDLQVGVV